MEPTSPHSLKNTSNHTSCMFSSVGRQTMPNWSNRFIKDFNDLTYNINTSTLKAKKGQWISPNQYRVQKNSTIYQFRATQSKQTRNNSNKSLPMEDKQIYKHLFRIQLMKMNRPVNPQKYDLIEQDKYSTLETQGLCKFQFDKTIAGRLKFRGHKHLDFKNHTLRDFGFKAQLSNTIQVTQGRKRKSFSVSVQRRNSHNKCHDFASYGPRRVFEPRQELDKIYDTDNYHRMIKPIRIKQTAKMEGLTGRKDPRARQCEILAYDDQRGINFTMRRGQSHEISRSPRNTDLGREIIAATRGCYR